MSNELRDQVEALREHLQQSVAFYEDRRNATPHAVERATADTLMYHYGLIAARVAQILEANNDGS